MIIHFNLKSPSATAPKQVNLTSLAMEELDLGFLQYKAFCLPQKPLIQGAYLFSGLNSLPSE